MWLLRSLIDRAVRVLHLLTAVFAIAFAADDRLAASDCAARAAITVSSIAVQVYRTSPHGNDIFPAAATVTLYRAGRTARTVKTDRRGFARISPPPGRYTAVVTTSSGRNLTQNVIVAARGGNPRVLAVLPWGECGIVCEVPGKTALSKPPDCLFAPRRVTP